MDFDVGKLFHSTVNLVCNNAVSILDASTDLAGSIPGIIVAICVHEMIHNDDGHPQKLEFVLGIASALWMVHLFENYKNKHIGTDKVSEQNNSSVAQEEKIRMRVLRFSTDAFPKLKYLQREIRTVQECLKDITPLIQLSLFKGSTEDLHSTKSDCNRERSSFISDSMHVLEDMCSIPFNIGNIYISIIGTKEQFEIIRTRVSPKIPAIEVYDYENGIYFDKQSRRSCTFEMSLGPPDALVFWIQSEIPPCNRNYVYKNLYMVRQFGPAEIIFVSKDDDHSRISQNLQESFPKNLFSDSDPDVIDVSTDELRKCVSIKLAKCIFKRMEILQKILKDCIFHTTADRLSHLCEPWKTCFHQMLSVQLKSESPIPEDETEKWLEEQLSAVRKTLENAVKNVESILRENPDNENISGVEEIPDDIVNRLTRLQSKGVTAFGLWGKEFKVFLNIKSPNDNALNQLKDDVKNILNHLYEPITFIHSNGPIIIEFIEQGHKIIPDKSKMDKYGTLGIFAQDQTKQLIGLTSGHVARKGTNLYIEMNEEPVLLGNCHLSSTKEEADHISDLSLIKIDPLILPLCNVKFLDGDRIQCRPTLFKGNLSEVLKNRVYKRGASTDWTRGELAAQAVVTNSRGQLIIVEGINEPFAKPGDSGSVVFMYDKEDPEHSKIHLVSMVSAGGQVAGKDNAVTFTLNQAVSDLKDTVVFNFDNESQDT